MGDDTHRSDAADPGPDAKAPPAASPGSADDVEEVPCPQATRQPGAETCAVQATGGTGHRDAGGQRTTHTTDQHRAVLHEERAEGAAGDAHPPQPATAEEHVHPGAARSPTREGMHDATPRGAPEREDILASVFNETALTARQGLQTDEQLHDDESFAAFMASCRDGALATGPATPSAPRHTAHNREPTSPTWDPVSASHQAHLRRNYAALRPVAAVHATTAGDSHAGGQPSEVPCQNPHAQDEPTHEVSTPAAGTISESTGRMPPQVAQPWGQESLDYAQSEGDAGRPGAEADRSAALDLDLWLPRTPDVEQLTIQVRTRGVLRDIHHIINRSRTMAEVIFNHHEGQHSPPPTVEHPSQWPYVVTRLMAYMGA